MLDGTRRELQVTAAPCGEFNDQPLYLISITSANLSVEIINLGGIIKAIWAPNRHGNMHNIVAGYLDIADYQDNPHYFGCLLGRNAGRISGAKFELDGNVVFLSQNEGLNHLHGGVEGFNKKVWKIKSFMRANEETGIIMEYLSQDGDEGYPGNLWVTVKYTLDGNNRLKIVYDAVTDKSTPLNLSNHSYFNLSGFATDVLGHSLRLNAAAYTENSNQNLPTGKILPVAGTPMDFLHAKTIGNDIAGVAASEGYNHNFVLNDHFPGKVRFAAELSEPYSGRVLKVFTDRPGVQVYTANNWQGNITGPQGYAYRKHSAIALEIQAFPDSPNHPGFPDTILHPGQRFISETVYEFSIIDN
ncbi:MAG: aldose epimerase family protein [Sphingobacteriales bacterium]